MQLPRTLLFLAALVVSSIPSLASPTINYAPRNSFEKRDEDLARVARAVERERLGKRTTFPDSPPSCKLCERDYDQIQSCANASVVLSNPSIIIFAPNQFLDVIECACTDTFQSAYPQCVDCFTQTNQTGFLVPENGNLSSVVTGMRQICGMLSTLLGGVASHNSQLPGQTPITVSDSSAARRWISAFDGMGAVGVSVGSAFVGLVFGVWTVLV